MKKQEFTYNNNNGEHKVVMSFHSHKLEWFVDVMNEYSVALGSTNFFKTEKEAQKRFNSIKKRVTK